MRSLSNKFFFTFIIVLSTVLPLFPQVTIDSLLKKFNNTKLSKIERGEALDQISTAHFFVNPDTAFYYGKQLLNFASANNLKPLEAIGYYDIGVASFAKERYPQAIGSYLRALKIFEELGDTLHIANTNNVIGICHYTLRNTEKAEKYYLKALEAYKSIHDTLTISTIYNNLGLLATNTKEIEKAISYYNKSIEFISSSSRQLELGVAYSNLGMLYVQNNKFELAKEILEKSELLLQNSNNASDFLTLYTSFGDLYVKLKQFDKAETYCKKGLKIALEIGGFQHASEIYYNLSKIYEARKDYKTAFDYYRKYKTNEDSVTSLDRLQQMADKEAQFEYSRKSEADSIVNAEAQKLKDAQLTIQKSENEKQKIQLNYTFFGLALAVFFGFFIFNRFRVTHRQKKIIENQKLVVEEKHKEITDSINYAERIQKSFLATKNFLDQCLNSHIVNAISEPSYFVFFKPKAIVSGDFYWGATLNNGDLALATADSTGHGVPGAIMSILNISSLEKAIEKSSEPAEILNLTREIIIERLKNDGSEEGGKDGMDASLIVLNAQKTELKYAAAFNPIWILRDKVIIELKADRMPIGKSDKDNLPFTQKSFQLNKGDIIYTFTDGLTDQFGGKSGKKFKASGLKELLISIGDKNMQQQQIEINTAFENWIGNLEQIDDICLIGIKI